MESTTAIANSVTREDAQEFLRGVAKRCNALTANSKHGKEKITFRFHKDNFPGAHTLTYTQVVNGVERGRSIIGRKADGKLAVISEYSITPQKSITRLPAVIAKPKMLTPTLKVKKRKPLRRGDVIG